MFWNIDWNTLAAFFAVSVGIGGIAMWALRAEFVTKKQAESFATKTDVEDMSVRIEAVETRLKELATHGEIGALTQRVAGLETAVAVAGSEINATKEGVGRVEHQLTLMNQHLLSRERQQ